MVKNSGGSSGKKSIFKSVFSLAFLIGLIILGFILFFTIYYLQVYNKTDQTKPLNNAKNTFEPTKGNNIEETPSDLFIKGKFRDGNFLALNRYSKSIFEYDRNTKKYYCNIKVRNNKNYIKTLKNNDQWIIWVEDESLIADTSNQPYKWELVAENILTKEQIVIDKSSFNTNKLNVPPFIYYTPSQLAISGDNIITYCKTIPNKEKVGSQLVIYDLNKKTQKVINTTNDVTKEVIYDCSINSKLVVWSKFRKINDDMNFRVTQYKYSDLFTYNLKSGEIMQITSNDYYFNTNIFNDKIVAAHIPLRKQGEVACNSEIVLIDVDNKKIRTIVDKNSSCNKNQNFEIYRCNPKINKKYVSWYNNGFDNMFIFDYKADKFVEVYRKRDNNDDSLASIYDMFDNCVLLSINRPDVNTRNLYIRLN
jgi:hypothetical protein